VVQPAAAQSAAAQPAAAHSAAAQPAAAQPLVAAAPLAGRRWLLALALALRTSRRAFGHAGPIARIYHSRHILIVVKTYAMCTPD
jgi:hypothetical protein